MRFLSRLLANWLANIGGGKRRQCWLAKVEFLRGMVRRNSIPYFC